MFIYVHTFRTVCLSVLEFEHPRGGRVKIRGLLWNQSTVLVPIFIGHPLQVLPLDLPLIALS